ncbi:MAG TPA: LysR substrate-binding domain-containing protein [Rhodopila sp.]|nr:LysR substrate-binding domain-containing protein [Rhodopila sp.]
MNARTNLDMDVLRTFATGFELGSFARAADRLGRSQSAVSTQLRKLEEQIGRKLVQKSGRGLTLTQAGESLLSYAHRILDLNDEAVDSIRGADMEGWVRLGLPQDFAERWLPSVLGRFARAHPKVRVEVRAEATAHLLARLLRGELDLCLAWGDDVDAPHAERVTELPVSWIARPDWPGLHDEPLSLIQFEAPCLFRTISVAALDAAGIPWRLAFISPSLAGMWAAAEAGLGVAVRTAVGQPPTLAALTSGLPPLPNLPLTLHMAQAQPTPAVRRLADILRETVLAETARLEVRS